MVVLRAIDGLDYREIAQVLNLKLGTVRSRLHRARTQLRDLLQNADAVQRTPNDGWRRCAK